MKPEADTILAGELARRAGVNLETLRYYERRGLLPRPPRTRAGYRTFPAGSVRRVRFIKDAQALGFTLAEIKEFLALRLDPDSTCADVRRRAEAKVSDIERRIASLRAMKMALVRLAASCPARGPASGCSILESLGR